jgi:hypothetical protein
MVHTVYKHNYVYGLKLNIHCNVHHKLYYVLCRVF